MYTNAFQLRNAHPFWTADKSDSRYKRLRLKEAWVAVKALAADA